MEEREMMRRWVQAWMQAGPELRELEIEQADNLQVLLEGAFTHALRTLPPRSPSGMFEMQAWFAKLR